MIDIKSLIEKQREKPNDSYKDYHTTMGDVWFVAYAKYAYLDENYMKWNTTKITEKSMAGRKSSFKNSIYMHEIWLTDIKKKNDALKSENKEITVNENKLGIDGKEFDEIVNALLSKTREERLSHCEKTLK